MNERYIHISIVYKGKLYTASQTSVVLSSMSVNSVNHRLETFVRGKRKSSEMDTHHTPLLPKLYSMTSIIDYIYYTKYY